MYINDLVISLMLSYKIIKQNTYRNPNNARACYQPKKSGKTIILFFIFMALCINDNLYIAFLFTL